MSESKGLLELVMSQRQFKLADPLLEAYDEAWAEDETFGKRLVSFLLRKIVHENWRFDDMQKLRDALGLLRDCRDDFPDNLIPSALAKLLQVQVEGKNVSKEVLEKKLLEMSPEEDDAAVSDRKTVLDTVDNLGGGALEFLVDLMDLDQELIRLAEKMEASLPQLNVVTTRQSLAPEVRVAPAPAVEEKFNVHELYAAFGEDLQAWSAIFRQTNPEVVSYLNEMRGSRTKTPKPPTPGHISENNTPNSAPPRKRKSSKKQKSPALPREKKKLSTSPSKKLKQKKTSSAAAKKKKAKGKATVKVGKSKRRFWSPQEEENLVYGVEKYGSGSWQLILRDRRLEFNERTSVNLKDKWRNLEKNPALIEDYQRELKRKNKIKRSKMEEAEFAAGAIEDEDAKRPQDEVEDIEDSEASPKTKRVKNVAREKTLLAREARLKDQEMQG